MVYIDKNFYININHGAKNEERYFAFLKNILIDIKDLQPTFFLLILLKLLQNSKAMKVTITGGKTKLQYSSESFEITNDDIFENKLKENGYSTHKDEKYNHTVFYYVFMALYLFNHSNNQQEKIYEEKFQVDLNAVQK